jgi:hypothetical protein
VGGAKRATKLLNLKKKRKLLRKLTAPPQNALQG